MEPRELLTGLMAGAVAVVFDIVPGLFSHLTLWVRNFRGNLLFGEPLHPHTLTEAEELQRPFGLAVFGVVLMAFTVIADLWN